MLHHHHQGCASVASKVGFFVPALAMLTLAVLTVAPVIAQAQGYAVSFSVVGIPAGVSTRYYVDNVLNGTMGAGETRLLNFTLGGPHTLSVDLNVSVGNDTRYQCRDNIWAFTAAGIHVFTYKAQHRLQVVSLYGSPAGADWYDDGATAYARLAANVTAGAEGVTYVFVKWEGDASGQGMISDPIVMDRAKKAVAAWKTQYRLLMSSDPVGIFPSSTVWLDEGSVTDFSAIERTNGTDARYVFYEWSGDYAGTSMEGSLKMDGPKSITAKYRAQFLLSVVFNPPQIAQAGGMPNGTWYDAGQTVRLGPVPQYIDVSSVERLALDSWKIDGAIQPGTSVDVPVDGPHRVELIYRTQYYLEVTSDYGETTGTGWYFAGAEAEYRVAYSGSDFPAKYTLAGWRLDSSNVTRTVGPNDTEVIIDRPYVIQAEWHVDYTPMWSLIMAIVLVVIMIVAVTVLAVKRPSALRNLAFSFRSGFRRRKIGAPSAGPPIPASWGACQNCGAKVSGSAEYCQSCGAVQVRSRITAEPDTETVDKRVYDYVVERRGEISLSRASKDLGLSVGDLKSSTERLKKKGRLA